MVRGGQGTRTLINDDEFLSWLAGFARSVELVTSVCTGSASAHRDPTWDPFAELYGLTDTN